MTKYVPVLDRRITLVQPTRAVDEEGNPRRNSWNNPIPADPIHHEVWAHREDIGGRESTGKRIFGISQTTTNFVIRWRSDIDTSWQVESDGQVFGIEAVLQIGRSRYLELTTKEYQV